MADGKALEIDEEIFHLLNGAVDNLPIHLGLQPKVDWDDFIEAATVQLDQADQTRTFQFGELYVTAVNDERSRAPTKTTARTHQYTLEIYVPYLDSESYTGMRLIHQKIQDKINNNPRPEQGTHIVSISSVTSTIEIDVFAGELAFYRMTYRFGVLEFVAHD